MDESALVVEGAGDWERREGEVNGGGAGARRPFFRMATEPEGDEGEPREPAGEPGRVNAEGWGDLAGDLPGVKRSLEGAGGTGGAFLLLMLGEGDPRISYILDGVLKSR